MQKSYRLRKREDFSRVYRRGKAVANRQLVLYYQFNRETSHFRLGVSVSKKVGRAVKRNRLKRLIKEAARAQADRIKPGYDLVVIVRKGAVDATYHDISSSLGYLLKKARLYIS